MVATLGEGDFCAAFLVNQRWVVRVAKHAAAGYEDYGAELLGRVVRGYIGAEQGRLRPPLERVARFVALAAIAWAPRCPASMS